MNNKRITFWKFLSVLGGVWLISGVQQAEAVPAFARQTGMACISCHAGAFPALNSFGRAFRAQGYTMRGAAGLVEGEDLSIPDDLKASFVAKLRYNIDGETDNNRGLIQWPEEAALLIGGRASEKAGFLLEAGQAAQVVEAEADTGTGAVTFTDVVPGGCAAAPTDPLQCQAVADTGSGAAEGVATSVLSFKLHYNVTDSIAAVLFTTDGLGVGYGMELMNTGLARSQRPIEFRKYAAAQRLGNASGGATGVALVYHDGNLMVNYSHWAPAWQQMDGATVNANLLGGMAHYLRANYFIFAGGWDLGFGANWMGGSVKVGKANPAEEIFVKSHGVDFQALGEVASLPTQLFLSYGKTPKSKAWEINEFNTSTSNDKSAYGITGKLGVMKNTSVYASHAATKSGSATESDNTIGLQYMLAQNMNLELYNVRNNGGKLKDGSEDKSKDFTMLQLFVGF